MLYIHTPSLKNGLKSFLLKNSVICSPWFLHSLASWILLHLSTFLVNDHRWSTSPCKVTPLGGNNPALAPVVSSSSPFPFAISELLLLPQTLSAVSCLCLYYIKIYASWTETYVTLRIEEVVPFSFGLTCFGDMWSCNSRVVRITQISAESSFWDKSEQLIPLIWFTYKFNKLPVAETRCAHAVAWKWSLCELLCL